MTDSENSQPQDDSDEDIYKDIPEFNFEEELAKLEGSTETYKQEASDLSEKVKALTQENKELKKLNEVLKKNLSTLLKTAQAEVHRKDSVIEELRSKVDSFTFRRKKRSTSDKITSTDDLISSPLLKQEFEKYKGTSGKRRSKSYENWTSSDSERRCNQDDDKKAGVQHKKEEKSNCGEKESDYHRGNAQNTNFRPLESNRDTHNEKHQERKSSRYEDRSVYRRSFRENHRDHLLYDSYDKKRYSRSSDNRFLSRQRSSRERRRDRGRSESCERRRRSHRRRDSSERASRRSSRKEKSRSRGSKESSLEKPKSRFSLDNELVIKTKEGVEVKPELSKNCDGFENKRSTEGSEKNRKIEGFPSSKQKKEKNSGKSDRRKNVEIFNTKSPLDALYNDMVSSRAFSQISNCKGGKGVIHSESNLEGELLETGNEFQKTSQAEGDDWTRSFKNERQNETKPMTLYSRRMMHKFSSQSKEKQLKKCKEEKEVKEKTECPAQSESSEQMMESEKEPGELTDDENVIESSKEFQELTKVAALESEIIKNPATECCKESFGADDIMKIKPSPKDSQMESEIFISDKEESAKDIESKKEMSDVIEFSPFKNNYKLIEISPIKPTGSEHILDFFSKKMPPVNPVERTKGFDSLEGKTKVSEEDEVEKFSDASGEKDLRKNSSSENSIGNVPSVKGSTKENNVGNVPSVKGSTKENNVGNVPSVKGNSKEEEILAAEGKEPHEKEEKEVLKKRKTVVTKEKSSLKKGKKRSRLKNETEKLTTNQKSQKRKRKFSDEAEAKTDSKKLKLEKIELPRKSLRKKRNSKSELESQHLQQTDIESRGELENKMNEDAMTGEFFKPITRPEVLETPIDIDINKCPATDYKIAATMSVTGVVRLETPNKCIGKLKNLMINEQMIFNFMDSKNNSQFSPIVGSKSIEMTPRRMLKNDLMLTDSEDDSVNKRNAGGEDFDEVEERVEEEEEEEEDEKGGLSGSEYSDCGSDSGASDFVDLL